MTATIFTYYTEEKCISPLKEKTLIARMTIGMRTLRSTKIDIVWALKSEEVQNLLK